MATLPYLVVLTGYPSVGKSIVSKHLVTKHSFVRVSSDEMRNAFYMQEYPELIGTNDGQAREELVWSIMQYSKLAHLEKGFSVVVDTTATENSTRDYLLSTLTPNRLLLKANKYLVHLYADKSILDNRNSRRGRTNDTLRLWDEHWEKPLKKPEIYNLLEFKNNNEKDLEEIISSLDSIFSSRRMMIRI
jgi:predicted kinase